MPIYEASAQLLTAIPVTSFAALGLKERGDLQRLLAARIDALEGGLLVLTEEFADWADSVRRIDLLCLDSEAGCRHDDGGSSREPVGCSRSCHHTRCPPAAPLTSTNAEPDKSHIVYSVAPRPGMVLSRTAPTAPSANGPEHRLPVMPAGGAWFFQARSPVASQGAGW